MFCGPQKGLGNVLDMHKTHWDPARTGAGTEPSLQAGRQLPEKAALTSIYFANSEDDNAGIRQVIGHLHKKAFDGQLDVSVGNHGLGSGLFRCQPIHRAVHFGRTGKDPVLHTMIDTPADQITGYLKVRALQRMSASAYVAAGKMKNPIDRWHVLKGEAEITLKHIHGLRRGCFAENACDSVAPLAGSLSYLASDQSARAGDKKGNHYCTL